MDPDYRKHYFLAPVIITDTPDYTEKWIVYNNPYIAAKELTVKPGKSVVITDETAYGCIVVQGYGKLQNHSCAVSTMLRFGGLSEDEFFVSGQRAAAGVRFENHSSSEPLVILKHFPHTPSVPEK